jgi:hypothetical protein
MMIDLVGDLTQIDQRSDSAGVDGRLGGMPLADYQTLSFFVKGPELPAGSSNGSLQGTLSFIITSDQDSIKNGHLEANIPLSAFRAGQWSKVTIRYQGNDKGIFVDGGDSTGSWMRYQPIISFPENSGAKSVYTAILVNPVNNYSALKDASICIDEIILEEPLTAYRINGGAAFEYSRPGTLLSINGLQVLSDLKVTSAVESELRIPGIIPNKTVPENQSSETMASMVNRTDLELFLFGVKITGNVAFTAANDTFLWNAGHGIVRKWDNFSIGEEFYASPLNNSAHHYFFMDLSTKFSAKFNADVIYDFFKMEQKWNFNMGYKPDNIYIPSVFIETNAFWRKSNDTIEEKDYGELWIQTWENLIPDLGGEAAVRTTSTFISITEETKPVGAVLTLEGRTNSTYINNITILDNSLRLDVPVVLPRVKMNFSTGRNFKRNLLFYGDDALDDAEKFFESINDSLPLWVIYPVYSLFTPELHYAMDKSMEKSSSFELTQYTAFNDYFTALLTLPNLYNLASLYIPSGLGIRLERIIEQKMDTRSDMLNLGASLGFSSINMFGRLGYLPLFNFYLSDEFNHAVESSVIIPFPFGDQSLINHDINWRVQSIAGMTFRGFTGGVAGFLNTFTIRSPAFSSSPENISGEIFSGTGSWSESVMLEWITPVNKSLLGFFYDWIASSVAIPALSSIFSTRYEHLRRESMELTLEKTNDNFRMSLLLGHEVIIRILGKLNFNGFIKLRFNEDEKSSTYTFDALMGTGLRVLF